MVSESAPRASEATVHVRELSTLTVDDILLAAGVRTVSRAVALRVPAFTRAYKVFTHTISSFPLREYVDGGGVAPRPFLVNPSQLTTYPALIARTVGDLLCHDVAYWRITSRAWDGFPASAEWLPYDHISETLNYETGLPEAVAYRGAPLLRSQYVRFDGDGTGGWLTTGVSAVNLAASLLATVVNTAEVPAPSVILKNAGPDLKPEQVDALLDAWEDARQSRTTAYLNSTINAESLTGYSPNELQLVESRNAAAVDLARNANLDPIWLGAGVPGSSLTYANRVDLRKDLIDLALSAPMSWITARLSQPDVTPRGHTVGFFTDAFLLANTPDLVPVLAEAKAAGFITTEQGAALLDIGGQRP